MRQIILFVTAMSFLPVLSQAQFRGKLQYTFVGETTQDMKIDLMGNYKVKVKNISTTMVSRIITEFHGLNGDGSVVTTGGGGFAVFPNGGYLYLAPGDSVVVQGWSAGWFECTNCALVTGNNSKKVRFMFSQNGTTERDTLIQDITIINNSDATVNALSYVTSGGAYNIKGSFKVPAYIRDSIQELRFFLQNSNSNNRDWQITPANTVTSPFGDVYYHFNFNATNRTDWRIQVRPGMKPGVKWFVPHTNVAITGSGTSFYARLAPFGVGNFAIDSVKTYRTATGFWRGAFAPSDSSLIAFPGQENWSNPNVNKLNSRMYKLKLNSANFGDTAWSYLIGDETWGGDASKDGRYAVYLLNQGGLNSTNASIDWAAIINAQTGQKIWGSGGNLVGPSYSGLEVGMSRDGRYFAIGSTGDGFLTLFQNNHAVNGTATVTQLWQTTGNHIGQVRKIVFSDDGQHVYAGCGDMFLRKYKIADGTLVWRAYIGGWPFINGLKFSTDSAFIYTGTKSKDITKINVQTGAVSWFGFSGNLDVHNSRNGRYVMDFSGQLFDNSTGSIVGKVQPSAQKAFAYLDDFVISADRGIDIYHPFGSLHATRNISMNDGSGEQSQFMWNDTTGTKVVVLSRDMVSNGPPKNGIGFWRITPSINRYPTSDSIPNFALNTGDSVYTVLRYADRDAHALSTAASSSLSKLVFRVGTNDTLWIKATSGYSGTDTATVRISETGTTERLSIRNLFTVTATCASTATATAATATTFCSGGSVVLNANTGTGFTYQWLKDAANISGATAATYTATTSGSYTVRVTNAGGCAATSSAITVTVNSLPAATITAATATTFCNGGSVVLNGNTGTGFTYQWLKDTVNITGATAVSYTATASGSYTVTVTNSNGCSATSSATTTTVISIPSAPTVSAVSYCQGSTASALTATAGSGNSLLWYTLASGGTGSATAPTPSTATAGIVDFYVSQVTTTGGCESARAKLTVTVNTTPAAPTIVRNVTNELVSSALTGNLWYKEGVALSDTTQKFKPTTAGNYSVKTTQNGCASALSANYYYLVTSVVSFSNSQYIRIYPNPVREDLRIDYKLDGQYQLRLMIYDVNGKLVLNKEKMNTGSLLSLRGFSRGTYLIRIHDKNGKLIYTDKIIKE